MGEVRGSEVWGDPGRKGNEYFYQHWGPKNMYMLLLKSEKQHYLKNGFTVIVMFYVKHTYCSHYNLRC